MPTTTAAKKQAEPRRINIGRPPLSPEGSVTMNIRLTPTQRAKVDKLGGPEWIRNKIDRATVKE